MAISYAWRTKDLKDKPHGLKVNTTCLADKSASIREDVVPAK